MKPVIAMKRFSATACVGLALWVTSLPSTATAPAPAEGRVSVSYEHPQDFSEAREFGRQDSYRDSDYLKILKTYLIKRASASVAPDQRLQVTITDLKLAGAYEPWHGVRWQDVRIMRDIYPPSIELRFTLSDAHGRVVREGTRTLRNLDYLQSGPNSVGDSDPLRYDKALLDRWLRREKL